MEATSWFDADMCAVLGAVLCLMVDDLNTVHLSNIPPGVKHILSRNGFLSHYGREKMPDRWNTTVSYRRFDVRDDLHFASYIEDEYAQRPEMPDMSPELLKKFRHSVLELFSNAVWHSQTRLGIFSCGQFYSQKNRLAFTVVDLGIGMRQNIKNCLGLELSSTEAIVWCTTGSNTTRRGSIPGGLGLKILCDFIDLNGGCIQIVSDDGYWQRERQRVTYTTMSNRFPGTAVNILINSADPKTYVLSSELHPDDIF